MATRFIRRRHRDSESGAELVEFSLVFMILMMVVLGIVDFALLFQRNEVLTNATREGARVAVLPGYTPTDVQNRVMTFVAQGGVPISGGNPAVTVTATTIPELGGTRPATTVNVAYNHDYIFIGAIATWFGGAGYGTVSLQHESTMRNELAAAAP